MPPFRGQNAVIYNIYNIFIYKLCILLTIGEDFHAVECMYDVETDGGKCSDLVVNRCLLGSCPSLSLIYSYFSFQVYEPGN